MISSLAGKVGSHGATLTRGASYRRRARGRPSWKNESDAATYEKQNEGACAAASVLSETPGAFLHFHPLLRSRSSCGCLHPLLRALANPRNRPSTTLFASRLARSRARRPFSSRISLFLFLFLLRRFLQRLRRSQPPLVPAAQPLPPWPAVFLHFNTFLNGWKNK